MTTKRWIIAIVTVLILSFLLGYCNRQEPKTEIKEVVITVPEKTGEFNSPDIFIPKGDNIKTIIKYKDTIISLPQINQELVEKYLTIKEERDRLLMYADAVKINSYENVFDNKDVKLTIKSKTEGKLLELIPEYVIKPQEVKVPIEVPKPKERVFSMNLGAGLNTTTKLEKLEPTVNLDLVNKKGNILSASLGTQGTVSVSYKVNILNIRK